MNDENLKALLQDVYKTRMFIEECYKQCNTLDKLSFSEEKPEFMKTKEGLLEGFAMVTSLFDQEFKNPSLTESEFKILTGLVNKAYDVAIERYASSRAKIDNLTSTYNKLLTKAQSEIVQMDFGREKEEIIYCALKVVPLFERSKNKEKRDSLDALIKNFVSKTDEVCYDSSHQTVFSNDKIKLFDLEEKLIDFAKKHKIKDKLTIKFEEPKILFQNLLFYQKLGATPKNYKSFKPSLLDLDETQKEKPVKKSKRTKPSI